jgi:hypothetical protein
VTIETPPGGRTIGTQEWEAVQASPEFAELRGRLRRFVFPVTALFLGWYAVYVLLATYVRLDVRDHRVVRALRRPSPRPSVEQPARAPGG